jgi:hypothetical protein
MPATVRTLGIDLASQPEDTAVCVVEWRPRSPRVVSVSDFLGSEGQLDDPRLLELILHPGIGRVAIDAPFGWPVEFVDGIANWRNRREWPIPLGDPAREQARLVLRETDRQVHRITGRPTDPEAAIPRGKWPLSVSRDKLGITAMRCMRLLAEVQRRRGRKVDRSGRGRFVEVYPDAALREWGCWPASWDRHPRRGYKGTTPEHRRRRQELILRLKAEAPWIGRDAQLVERCVSSDDELDALVSALMARVVDRRKAQRIANVARAKLEGWIHLPQAGSLAVIAA